MGRNLGRVDQVFGVQLQNRIRWEQFHFRFFSYCCSLYTDFYISLSELFTMGLVMFSCLCFR
jgi:hypothetical protein